QLLAGFAPALAARVRRLQEVEVDSLGFAVRAERLALPYTTFLIPLDDVFHSLVTRDVVADPDWRACTLHFRTGMTREERLRRACELLALTPEDLSAVSERRHVLPAPRLGHAELVRELE